MGVPCPVYQLGQQAVMKRTTAIAKKPPQQQYPGKSEYQQWRKQHYAIHSLCASLLIDVNQRLHDGNNFLGFLAV